MHLPVRDYAWCVSLVQRVQRARLQTMYTDVAKVRRIKKWLLDEPLVRLKIYLEITEAHLFRTLHARGAAAYCACIAAQPRGSLDRNRVNLEVRHARRSRVNLEVRHAKKQKQTSHHAHSRKAQAWRLGLRSMRGD